MQSRNLVFTFISLPSRATSLERLVIHVEYRLHEHSHIILSYEQDGPATQADISQIE
jgi:hypothetical protein